MSDATHKCRHSSEPVKITSPLARVKTMFSASPLGRRRHGSLGNIPAAIVAANATVASPHNGLVWGVPLNKLVLQHTSEHNVPFIVERVVEYVEKHGLSQEGLYRVNGSARVIEKLKASFDKTGDANLNDVDIAALGGLLKLFLRDIPEPLITEDISERFVELHKATSNYTAQQYYQQIRNLLKQLPPNHYHLLKYLINHLVTVAKHEEDNKMSPVSLSIVFGPNLFRCKGLEKQGVCNSFLSKMITKYDQVFMDDEKIRIEQVKEEAMQRRGKPQKPLPYSVHVESLSNIKEFDECDGLSSSYGHGSLTTVISVTDTSDSTTDNVANERNVDECFAHSPPPSHELTRSHELSRSLELSRSYHSDSDLGTGKFAREAGIRRRSSKEVVRKKSLSPQRDEELPRTPSPWSQISSSSVSPTSSPVQPTSHAVSQYLAAVIEQTVRQLLLGPERSCNPPPAVPIKPISSARQRRKVSSNSKADRSINSDTKETDDIMKSESCYSDKAVTDESQSNNSHRVLMRRGSSKEEQERKRLNRESGALFSDSINVMDQPPSVDQTDGNTKLLEEGQVKSQRKQPAVKGFELFESLGIVMGAPISQKSKKPVIATPIESTDDNSCHHFVMTSLELHDEEDSLSQSTGSYSVKLATASLTDDDLNIVKKTTPTLEHPTLSRPHAPAKRRLPSGKIAPNETVKNPNAMSTSRSVCETRTTVSNKSKSLPSLKPRHHKDLINNTDSLNTTASNSHTKAVTVDPLVHSEAISSATIGWSTLPPKLNLKLVSDSSSTTVADTKTTTSSKTTSEQYEVRTATNEFHIKPLTTATTTAGNELQAETNATSDSVPAYLINTNTDDVTKSSAKIISVKPQVKPRVKVNTDSSTASDSSKHVTTATTSDIPDSHTDTNSKAINNLHTTAATKHTLDVVSVEETAVGWRPNHEAAVTNDEVANAQRKRLKEIKRSVRKFEEMYKGQHGVKPTGKEKDPIRPLLREYINIKKHLQQEEMSLPADSSDEMLSKTAPAKLSGLHDEHKIVDHDSDQIKSALVDCQKMLADSRRRDARPDNLDHMSVNQLQEEKVSVQKVLLEFEKQYGRPQTEAEREVMRPLYDYYRQLKKIISGCGLTSINKSELALTTVSMAPTQQQDYGVTTVDDSLLTESLCPLNEGIATSQHNSVFSSTEDVVSSSDSFGQLKEQLDVAIKEKHKLSQIIHKHETNFRKQHGRPVKDKEDRRSVQHHYDAYKRIKAHVKLLETLIIKKDSNVTV